MNKRYDVITIDKDLAVVVDKEAVIAVGELTLQKRKDGGYTFFTRVTEHDYDWIQVTEVEGHIPIQEKDNKKAGVWYTHPKHLPKIIATIGKQIEGLPLVVLPEEDELLEAKARRIGKLHNMDGDALYGFKEGYKAAQQRSTYTEEDLKNAFDAGYERGQKESGDITTHVPDWDEYLQSLQPKRFPISVELPIRFTTSSAMKGDGTNITPYFLNTNPDNTIHPVNVYYDDQH